VMNYFWNTATSHGDDFDLLSLLAASAMKVTFLLGLVALLCLGIRRLSAATRHLLWTLSLCAALLLPFLSAIEVWEVPVLPAPISSWSPAAPSNEIARTSDVPSQLPAKGMLLSLAVQPEINEGVPEISASQPAPMSTVKPLAVSNSADENFLSEKRGATFLSKLVEWAIAIWLAGVLLLLFRLLVGLTATKGLTRGAREFKDPKLMKLFSSLLSDLQVKGRVRLLRSERTLMPVVCGVLRPVVLLPAGAEDWSEERQKVVLLHELTHVTRRDCLTQLLAQMACAFYWFNPLVWHAARRLRIEREQACDDYVLRIGTKPSDYAHHLLEIARYLQEHPVFQWSQATTVAMARQSQLEGRLLAILSHEGTRRAMSQLTSAGLCALMLVLFLSLAVVRPTIGGARNPSNSETASAEKTEVAEESPAGLFSLSTSGSKIEATSEEANALESGEAQDSDLQSGSISPEKPVNGAEGDEAGQVSEAELASDVSEETPAAPPQLPVFPLPPDMLETSHPAIPYIKSQYQDESKSGAQGKSGDYIDEMASVGYTNLSVNELVSLKASGVSADYVRSMRALGLGNLTLKDLSNMSVNGVTPAYIEAVRNAGYRELSVRDIVSFRIHGVTPEFIDRLRSAGYDNLSARQLTEFAVHEVTPQFIASMRSTGLGNLSPRDIVTLRAHGITAEFVREARKRLGDLSVKQIVAVKIEGLLEGSDKK
jgi:beta-lactamase regulating signal transducer with metallopeptidase domain